MFQILYITIPFVYALIITLHLFIIFDCKIIKIMFFGINISCITISILVFVYLSLPQYIFSIVWFFVVCLQLYTIFDFKMFKSVFISTVLVFQLLIITSIIVNVQALFSPLLAGEYYTNIIFICGVLFCSYLLFKYDLIAKFIEIYKSEAYCKNMFLWLLCCSMMLILALFLNRLYYTYTYIQTLYACAPFILMMRLFTLIQHSKMSLELENAYYKLDLLKDQNEYQRIASNRQSEYIKNLRKIKHDMSNQLKNISYLIQDENYAQAQIYIDEVSQELVEVSNIYRSFSDHQLLDDLLQYMNSVCKEKGISFSSILKVNSCNIDHDSLYILLSYYLENLIKEKEDYQIQPYMIHIHSKYNENWLTIHLESSLDPCLRKCEFAKDYGLPKEVETAKENLAAFITNELDEFDMVIKTIILIPTYSAK